MQVFALHNYGQKATFCIKKQDELQARRSQNVSLNGSYNDKNAGESMLMITHSEVVGYEADVVTSF